MQAAERAAQINVPIKRITHTHAQAWNLRKIKKHIPSRSLAPASGSNDTLSSRARRTSKLAVACTNTVPTKLASGMNAYMPPPSVERSRRSSLPTGNK